MGPHRLVWVGEPTLIENRQGEEVSPVTKSFLDKLKDLFE